MESQQHKSIKLLLVDYFKQKGWEIEHIDGEGEETDLVKNDGDVGDGENKRPDVDAKDREKRRIIRGETKVNNGDFDSDHSITQYKLFTNRRSRGIDSWLIIGVPEGTKEKMEMILSKVLEKSALNNVEVWEC